MTMETISQVEEGRKKDAVKTQSCSKHELNLSMLAQNMNKNIHNYMACKIITNLNFGICQNSRMTSPVKSCTKIMIITHALPYIFITLRLDPFYLKNFHHYNEESFDLNQCHLNLLIGGNDRTP